MTHAGLKVGARNSATDAATIQGIHDHAVMLGALCGDGSTKAVSIDEELSARRSAIYQALRAHRGDDDWRSYVAYVYPDYGIVERSEKGATTFLQIPYTLGADGAIVVSGPDMWQEVERDWIAKQLQTTYAPGEQDQPVVAAGGEIKSLAETPDTATVGGYLILFGSPTATDASDFRDFFTKDTDFCIPPEGAKTAVYYHHGLDPALKRKRLGTGGTLRIDDVGVWIEAQLNLRDKYEAALYNDGVKNGKMGWSSGTAPHLVERQPVKGAHEIKYWPLGLDASLTPTPAEPRTLAIDLSSASTGGSTKTHRPQDAGDASASVASTSGAASTPIDDSEDTMTKEEIEALAAASATKAVRDVLAQLPARSAEVDPPSGDQDEAALKTAYVDYIRTGEKTGAIKSLVEGTDASGGVLAPVTYRQELIQQRVQRSVLRAMGVRVIPIAGGTKELKIPYESAPTGALAAVAELGVIAEEDPNFGDRSFKPYKYPKITRIAEELLEDSPFDIVNDVLVTFANKKFAITENTLFATGNGTTQPEGIFLGANIGVTAASATTFTYAELVALFFSVDEGYRQNGVWLMSDAAAGVAATMAIPGSGGPVMTPGEGGRMQVLGKPVWTTAYGPALTANQRPIVFGDPTSYCIVDFGEAPNIKRLDEKYAETGEIGFRWQIRVDGAMLDPAGMKSLRMAAS